MRRSASAGVPLAPPGCGQVNTRKEQSQLGHRELDPGRARNQVGPAFGIKMLKGAGLEPLVPDGQAVVIPEEDLDPISAAVEEEEEMAGQGVLAEAFPNQAGEAVEALAHIGGLGAEKDAHRGGK